jgi:hypothetical protein
MFFIILLSLFGLPLISAAWLKQKTRDCLGNRGSLENSMFGRLESSSHVAGKPGDAMPNGHLAAAARGAQISFERSVHFY